MSGLEYRPAQPADAGVLFEIMAEALAAEAEAGGMRHTFPDRGLEVRWLAYVLGAEAAAGWVAEGVAGPLGFGCAVVRGGVRWLVSLFVRPEAQGSGIGQRLLDLTLGSLACLAGPAATLVDTAGYRAQALYMKRRMMPVLWIPSLEVPVRRAEPEATLRAGASWSEAQAAVNALDREVLGAARESEHASYWQVSGFHWRSFWDGSGRPVGYAYWNRGGRLGPAVVRAEGDWPAVLAGCLGEMAAQGFERARLMVPGCNEAALAWLLGRGAQLRGSELLLSTMAAQSGFAVSWRRYVIHRAALP